MKNRITTEQILYQIRSHVAVNPYINMTPGNNISFLCEEIATILADSYDVIEKSSLTTDEKIAIIHILRDLIILPINLITEIERKN